MILRWFKNLFNKRDISSTLRSTSTFHGDDRVAYLPFKKSEFEIGKVYLGSFGYGKSEFVLILRTYGSGFRQEAERHTDEVLLISRRAKRKDS